MLKDKDGLADKNARDGAVCLNACAFISQTGSQGGADLLKGNVCIISMVGLKLLTIKAAHNN